MIRHGRTNQKHTKGTVHTSMVGSKENVGILQHTLGLQMIYQFANAIVNNLVAGVNLLMNFPHMIRL